LEQSLYGEPTADTSTKLWHSLKIVAGFVIFVICATFAVLALFYFECYVLGLWILHQQIFRKLNSPKPLKVVHQKMVRRRSRMQ
uniref:Glycosyl-4,4'-diaponeurosporenoate acyltransferase n=1 Tax=Haemonchus placei TaxID=6290 RepID=A0A158QMZ5_HAEPC